VGINTPMGTSTLKGMNALQARFADTIRSYRFCILTGVNRNKSIEKPGSDTGFNKS